MRTTWLALVGDGPSGRRDFDKPAGEHLPADRVGTNVDKYGKVSSLGFAWRPIVAILIQLRARSLSISLLSGGSILQSKGGPFLPSREAQDTIVFDEGKGLSSEKQQYDPTSIINDLRYQVDQWRKLPNPNDWLVTPETARLLQHWRHHNFNSFRPFFCQIEAVETAIWLTEVAPKLGKRGKGFIEHLENANRDANPELMRLALKLATGAGKTTVMAMLIAWQTINAVRRPDSSNFTRGFLVVAPGLTIRDQAARAAAQRPDSYYGNPELVPNEMLGDLQRAKIVITNYHAFKLRDRMELSKGGRSLLQGRGAGTGYTRNRRPNDSAGHA